MTSEILVWSLPPQGEPYALVCLVNPDRRHRLDRGWFDDTANKVELTDEQRKRVAERNAEMDAKEAKDR
jgi:hypothetical protein